MNSEDKPVVHFLPIGGASPRVGKPFYVYALDHPRLGSQDVSTSSVVSVDAVHLCFETLYSRYVCADVTGFKPTFPQEIEADTTA